MDNESLPGGSKIKAERTPAGLIIQWKNPDNLLYRFGLGAFLLFWMGGWFTGETTAAQKLISDFQQGKPLETFLIFWLCGWTIGGFFVAAYIFKIIKGGGQTELFLGSHELRFKPGGTPVRALYGVRRTNNPFKALGGGSGINTTKQSITKLQIGYAGDRLRLTFDVGAERIEVGEFLTEPEKEWLHKKIETWLNDGGLLHGIPPASTMSGSSPQNPSQRKFVRAVIISLILGFIVFLVFNVADNKLQKIFDFTQPDAAQGSKAEDICSQWRPDSGSKRLWTRHERNILTILLFQAMKRMQKVWNMTGVRNMLTQSLRGKLMWQRTRPGSTGGMT